MGEAEEIDKCWDDIFGLPVQHRLQFDAHDVLQKIASLEKQLEQSHIFIQELQREVSVRDEAIAILKEQIPSAGEINVVSSEVQSSHGEVTSEDREDDEKLCDTPVEDLWPSSDMRAKFEDAVAKLSHPDVAIQNSASCPTDSPLLPLPNDLCKNMYIFAELRRSTMREANEA